MDEKPFSLKRLILKNTGYQMVAHVFVLAIGLVSTAVLSRYLGMEGFGKLNYVVAFFYFFLMLNDFGIESVVIREVSKNQDKANELIGSVLFFKVVLAALFIVVAWIAISVIRFSDDLKGALYLYALILPAIAFQLPAIIFHVVLKFEYPSVIGVISKATGFLLILIVVLLGYGLKGLILSYVVNEIFYTCLLIKYSKKYTKPVYRWNFKIVRQMIKPSVAIGTTMIFVSLVNRFDFLMLERMASIADVGLYAAAYRVTGLVEALPIMMMGSIFPLMSRYAKESPERLARVYWKTTLYLGLLSLPIGLAVTYFAPFIVHVIYGTEFASASRGLVVLVWSSVCVYWALSGGNLLICLGREKINMFIQGIAVVLNITLNLMWIPKAGFVGASAATVVTFFYIFIFTTFAAVYFLKFKPEVASPIDD